MNRKTLTGKCVMVLGTTSGAGKSWLNSAQPASASASMSDWMNVTARAWRAGSVVVMDVNTGAIRAMATGADPGDLSSLEDPATVEALRGAR